MISGKSAAGAGLVIAGLGIVAPASAVDIINRDKVEREVVVNTSDGQSSVLVLKAGERTANVCTSCVILVGETSVEATGRVLAVIQGGKVTIGR